jgi:hypothetical protein
MGWIEYVDWSCECRYYVPESKDVLPPPIEWEPCPALPLGIACEAMVTDWTEAPNPIPINPMMDRDTDGAAVLSFTRIAVTEPIPYTLHLVANADGPVRTAIMKLWSDEISTTLPGCALGARTVNEGKHLWDALGHQSGAELSNHQGVIGGPIDDLHPKVIAHIADDFPYHYSWAASANWVIKGGFDVHAYPWDMTQEIFVTSQATDPENLDFSQPQMKGDALFWTTSNNIISGVNSWNPVDGMRPFIRFIGDPTRAAGNLGTDGIDLVWSYGEGKGPNDTTYPVRSVMTAPFTTDPAALVPRRLRSQPSPGIAEREWQVGCGFAAHAQLTDMLVVRLVDGISWLFPLQMPDVRLYHAIGLTCTELFALADVQGRTNIVRIRLDSLGPGIPPD